MREPEAERPNRPRVREPGLQESRLRDERRSRTAAPARAADPAGAEPELAVDEAEDRGADELANGSRSVLVAGAVNPEVVVVGEPFRMQQEHDSDLERSETEALVADHDTRPTNRAAAMHHTELRGNDQKVIALLRFGDLRHGLDFPRALPKVRGTHLTLAVVVEISFAGFLQLGQDNLHALNYETPLYPQNLVP